MKHLNQRMNEKISTFLIVRKVPKEASAVKKFNESSASYRNELNSSRLDRNSDSNSFRSSECLDSMVEFFQGGVRKISLKFDALCIQSNSNPPMWGKRRGIINPDLTSESIIPKILCDPCG